MQPLADDVGQVAERQNVGGAVEREAVQFSTDKPFTWASGIQSPVYCDNRKINSDIRARETVLEAFLELINSKFKGIIQIQRTNS